MESTSKAQPHVFISIWVLFANYKGLKMRRRGIRRLRNSE